MIFSTDPLGRFASRLVGTRLATHIVLMFMYAIALRALFLHIGLLPFWLSYVARESPEIAAEFMPDLGILLQPLVIITEPQAVITAVLVSPWLFLILTIMLGWILDTMQGAFYTLLIPVFYKQPVDKAYIFCRHLRPMRLWLC